MKRKASLTKRRNTKSSRHKRRRNTRRYSNRRNTRRHRIKSNKRRTIYHNGRRLKVHTLRGGNKYSNVPMSNGYSLGGIELSPENLNLANRPPHTAYKKCL